MTAVLGLPCFGFVAGALYAGAATLPPIVTLLIFGSIGIGMGAPYLVLAAFPKLVDRIPRTGPASELVKQVMGLMLIAAAAYFIGSGLIGLVAGNPGWDDFSTGGHCIRTDHRRWMAGLAFQITPRWEPRIPVAGRSGDSRLVLDPSHGKGPTHPRALAGAGFKGVGVYLPEV